MSTWKKILTEDDGNLATANLTSTSTGRTFKLAAGTAILNFQDNSGNTLLGLATNALGVSTVVTAGTLKLFEDYASNQSKIELYSGSAASNYLGLQANSSATSVQNLKFPAGLPTANQILEVQSVSGSDVNLDWVDTPSGGGGVTINNNVDNFLLTATGTADTINGETSFRCDGTTLEAAGYVEYKPDNLGRSGELYDASSSGQYEITAKASSGDVIRIPKASVTTEFKVYTLDTGTGAGAAVLLSAASSSTNIDQIAMIAPNTGTKVVEFYLRGMLTVPVSSVNGTFSNSHGDRLYLDPSSSGVLTLTPPTGSSTYRRMMGYVISNVTISSVNYYIIWFDPSPEYVKIS